MSVKCEQPVQVPGMSTFPYILLWNQHKSPCDFPQDLGLSVLCCRFLLESCI